MNDDVHASALYVRLLEDQIERLRRALYALADSRFPGDATPGDDDGGRREGVDPPTVDRATP